MPSYCARYVRFLGHSRLQKAARDRICERRHAWLYLACRLLRIWQFCVSSKTLSQKKDVSCTTSIMEIDCIIDILRLRRDKLAASKALDRMEVNVDPAFALLVAAVVGFARTAARDKRSPERHSRTCY